MNPTREEALFALALEQPTEKRAAFLDAICEGDASSLEHFKALSASSKLASHSGILLTAADSTALHTIFHDTL